MTNSELSDNHKQMKKQLLMTRNKPTSSSGKCLLLKTLLFLLCIYIKRISSAPSSRSLNNLKCHPFNPMTKTKLGATSAPRLLPEPKPFDLNEHTLELICPLEQLIKPNCDGDYSSKWVQNCPFLPPSKECTLKHYKESLIKLTTVIWYKDGKLIHRINGNPLSYSDQSDIIKSVTLYDLGESDKGIYSCMANYTQLPIEAYRYFKLIASSSYDLTADKNGQVYLPDVKPAITHPPVNHTEKRGADVTFECKGIDTMLTTTIYWFKCLYRNDTCVTNFEDEYNYSVRSLKAEPLLKYRIENEKEDKLVVRNVSDDNVGYYGCWQVNRLGTDIRIARLDLLGEITTYPPYVTTRPSDDVVTTTYATLKQTNLRNYSSDNLMPLATVTHREFNSPETWIQLALLCFALLIGISTSAIYFNSKIKRRNNKTRKQQNLKSVTTLGKNLPDDDNTKQHLPDSDCLDIYNVGKIHPNLSTRFISGNLMQPNGQFLTQSMNNQILDQKDGRNYTIRSNNSDEVSSWGQKSIISSTHGDFSRAFYLHTSEKTTSTVPLYDHPPISTLTVRRTRQHHLCEPIVQDACVINPTYGFIRSDDGSDNMDGFDWSFPRRNLERLNKIGEGQFGEVWRYIARQQDGNESYVAVKQLKNRVGLGDRERLELIAEIEIMKSLNDHPNVIKLLNYCVDDHEPILLIMEYAEKGKLQTYLRSCRNNGKQLNMLYGYYASSSSSGGNSDGYGDIQSSSGCSSGSPSSSTNGSIIHHNITSKELITFSYHIAKGMEYVASKGIIHRDLASRNILVSSDNHCKVADFGFARRITDDCAYERTTANPVPVKWMAPEALVENKFTSKSDVFSFGILMWEIVTLGATPYEYMNSSEVYKKVTSGGRLDRPAHCKEEFFNIMSQCWLHDPVKRPTFGELALQLDKLVKSENDYIELDQYPEHAYYNIV